MAKKKTAAPKENEVQRQNLFLVPTDLIDIDDTLNGRWKPIDQDKIEHLARSMAEVGQLEPVTLRKVKGTDRYKVVFGYTRVKAIKWGNENGLFEPPLKVKAVTTIGNDENSFKANIIENLERNDTTPMDDAINHQRLREQYGWTDKQIAELYKCTQQKVSQYKGLLELPTKEQEKVHTGLLSVNAALLIVKSGMEEKEIPELIKSCTLENGRVDGSLVKTTIRNFANEENDTSDVLEDDEDVHMDDDLEDILGKPKQKRKVKKVEDDTPPGEPKKKSVPARSVKEIREFWEEQTGLVDPSPACGDFAKSMVKFIKGQIKPETMQKAFDKLYDSIEEELKGKE